MQEKSPKLPKQKTWVVTKSLLAKEKSPKSELKPKLFTSQLNQDKTTHKLSSTVLSKPSELQTPLLPKKQNSSTVDSPKTTIDKKMSVPLIEPPSSFKILR